jgi:dUTPase
MIEVRCDLIFSSSSSDICDSTGLAMDDGIFVYNSSGMVDGDNGDFIIIAPRYNATDAELEMVVERTTKLVNIFFEDEMSP